VALMMPSTTNCSSTHHTSTRASSWGSACLSCQWQAVHNWGLPLNCRLNCRITSHTAAHPKADPQHDTVSVMPGACIIEASHHKTPLAASLLQL
jgi:hypothetical protein